MIRDVGGSVGRAILSGIGRAASRIQEQKTQPVDLLESEEAYLAIFDASGTNASDVAVRLQGNTLTIRIDRFREFRDDYEMRFPGRGLTLNGRVELPDGASVDAERSDATITQRGTLEVVIPKGNESEASESMETSASVERTAEEVPEDEDEGQEDRGGDDRGAGIEEKRTDGESDAGETPEAR